MEQSVPLTLVWKRERLPLGGGPGQGELSIPLDPGGHRCWLTRQWSFTLLECQEEEVLRLTVSRHVYGADQKEQSRLRDDQLGQMLDSLHRCRDFNQKIRKVLAENESLLQISNRNSGTRQGSF